MGSLHKYRNVRAGYTIYRRLLNYIYPEAYIKIVLKNAAYFKNGTAILTRFAIIKQCADRGDRRAKQIWGYLLLQLMRKGLLW